MDKRGRLAVASITGLAEAYAALGRLTSEQAADQIRDLLARHRIPAAQVGEVLSQGAARYVDGDEPHAAAALQLLVDLGADVDRARALRVENANRRRLTIGDAQL